MGSGDSHISKGSYQLHLHEIGLQLVVVAAETCSMLIGQAQSQRQLKTHAQRPCVRDCLWRSLDFCCNCPHAYPLLASSSFMFDDGINSTISVSL